VTATKKPTGHLAGEATPQEVNANVAVPNVSPFGLHDKDWAENEWSSLLATLVQSGACTWKDVAALVLGHLNPSQVGTSLASSKGFKKKYGKGKTMKVVMEWAYTQTGKCADCGSRLELQADHMKGRKEYRNPLDADFIENMTLRCRRCNVVRRSSHVLGGLTFLTAEAGLMWILLVLRPRTFKDFVRMCRLYGMTMSDIRMEEAWAMAHWLSRANPPAYGIEDDNKSKYDIILWADKAVTRVDPGGAIPNDATRIYTNVPGSARLGFLTLQPDERIKFHEQPAEFIPFSTYDLGKRPPQALCVQYSPPNRKKNKPQKLSPLPPRNANIIAHQIRLTGEKFYLASGKAPEFPRQELADAPPYGKLVRTKIAATDCKLVSE
jgi:hypothetical protein